MAFKVNLPQTEVILPVTGKSIRVQPLVLRHQLAIAESEVHTLSERYKFLLEIFWDRIASKDEYNNSFDIFVSSIYEPDLQAIAYGIISITFKKPIPFVRACPRCGYINTFEIPVKDIIADMKINQGGKDSFYKEIHQFQDPDLGIVYNIKVPTMDDVLKALKFIESKNINLLQEAVNSENLEAFILKVAPAVVLPAIYSLQDAEGNEIKNNLNSKAIMETVYSILTEQIPDLTQVVEFIIDLSKKYYIKLGFNAICTNPECTSYKNRESEFYEVDALTDFFPIKT